MKFKHPLISPNLIKLAAILNDHQYHDGTRIGAALQLTRSAVWKSIKKLQGYGIKIESAKGKGYLLTEPLILLNPEKMPNNVVVFESIDSTNRYLKQCRPHKYPQICIAEQQTAGKGRFNRAWYSPFGKNIYLSCRYPFQKDVSELAGLSLLTSLAVVKTLHDIGIKDHLAVKWSNDIVYEGKKLAGNLVEVQAETHAECQAIIGIGLNVNMIDDLGHNISQQWTSVRTILGNYIDRNNLCGRLIYNLLAYLQKFETQGFATFLPEWDRVDYLKHKFISLNTMHHKISGTVQGINQQGYLLLQLPDGTMRVCSSGEASFSK